MSDFKSKLDWPTQVANLPTYQGGVPGRASMRKAEMEAGGLNGIRRVDWADERGNNYTLNTRNGMPGVVMTPARIAATPVTALRGWLAHIAGATKSALFSPYSLEVVNAAYVPPSTGYVVMPFTTTYNVAQPDSVHWGDVISFSASGLLINGKSMPLLSISGAIPASGSIPWLIPAISVSGGLGLYGDSSTNATTKRVFAVGRDTVHSWSGVDAVLIGALFRANDKAMVCGQRIEASQHKAWLSQLVFTGPSWDDYNSGWGLSWSEVSMLLTPPYLAKADGGFSAEQNRCGLDRAAPTGGSTVSPTPLPVTELALVGSGEIFDTGPGYGKTRWYWSGKFTSGMEGRTSTSYSQQVFGGATSSTLALGGREVVVSQSNTKQYRSNTESMSAVEQTIDMPPSGEQVGGLVLTATDQSPGGTFYWSGGALATAPGSRGDGVYYTYGGGIPGMGVYGTEEQTGSFSITLAGEPLVAISFSRMKLDGTRLRAIGTTTRLDSFLENPYGYTNEDISSGFGTWNTLRMEQDYTASVLAYNTGQAATVDALCAAKAGEWAASTVYDGGAIQYNEGGYYTSTTDNVTTDDQTLTWSTKDFILYDEPNGVFVSVEAQFSGRQSYGDVGRALLDITLKVVTPTGMAEQLMFHYEPTYLEMLVEQGLQTGTMYVPSPQLRLMFTPLHQEQGGFKGAAYTTATEVSNGAVPAYLFNFVLALDTYSAIGTDVSNSAVTRFIPCNLIEMLYGYVFSTKYGVDEYERYPVEFTARFTSLMTTLFATQWRVNYRDGVLIDWLDALGGAYITETTTELYRI